MSSPDTREVARLRGRRDPHDPVLRSKITRPDLPAWAVIRPRVDKLIAEGVRGPLTSLTGPPGAGKTMAILAWAASTRDPCTLAWLTVDDYDNRPQVFWPYLVAALRQAGIAVPRVVSGQSRAAVEHVFLARLASVLAAQDPPVVLVLDDLHLLTEPTLIDGISYLLRNAGSGLRLLVASRADPLLPLHRYRVAGQLAEVRADDLAFNGQESGLLLAHHGVTLDAPILERITGRTEGWAAGMRLAALSLQTRDDAEQFVKELGTGDSEITSYLVEEVLNAQPAPVRDMLLRTSVLDSFSADLACELTGDQRWADALPALARANAFVRPLGHGWYRYHSMFATVLRLKLRIECRGQLTDLYQRAARWCLSNGRLGEAVRYAVESGDWPLAAGMVVDEFAIGQLIEPRGHQPLAEAFKGMPQDKAWTQPEPLLVQAATRLRQGGEEAATAPLDAAESIIEHLPAGTISRPGWPRRLSGWRAPRAGDFEAAMAASGRAQALAGQLPEEVHARHPEVQVQVLAARGAMELWAGRLDEAAVSFAEGAAVSSREATHERARCLGYLALVAALGGRLDRAAEWAERRPRR